MKRFALAPFVAALLGGATDASAQPAPPKGKPPGAPEYVAKPAPTDGRHLALTIQKLENGFDPPRPFLVWAIGSSYCNMLGNGEAWQEELPRRFPQAPPIEYKKMVGNSVPWQYLRGWARHLVIPDQPDLVLIYTIGKEDDLERLIVELRRHTTADILVPGIHWRERDQPLWGKSENAADQDVGRVREICRRHGVEFVENRRDWGAYLTANGLPIEALLKDAVHQSDYGAKIINANLLAHIRRPAQFSYDPAARERRIDPAAVIPDGWTRTAGGLQTSQADARATFKFTGNRIDLLGRKSPTGGTVRVLSDGRPADRIDAFLMTYVQPGAKNAKEGRGAVPRDQAPHGVTLGTGIVPQSWTITMTSDAGDYTLAGSITGPDGAGNAFKPFTSPSGQILIEPELWRRAERNRAGDTFTFVVRRATLPEVSFRGSAGEPFRVRLAEALPGRPHTLELVAGGDGEATVTALDVFEPPSPAAARTQP